MSVQIGHARGGDPTYTPGDQTGNELRTQTWYQHSKGWNFVARFKDRAKAVKAAKFCKDACNNQHIGYSQKDRNSLRPLAKAAGWDATKITKNCNCDCTSFAAVCAEAGGVDMDGAYTYGNAPYSENIRQKLFGTGEFIILTDKKYLISDQYALVGDIYVNEPIASGHAVMVISDGGGGSNQNGTSTTTATAVAPQTSPKTIVATEAAHHRDEKYIGTFKVVAGSLNVRNGAGTSKKLLTKLSGGDKVTCYGYYNTSDGVDWLYVMFTQGNVTYSAFVCSTYLKKL